MTLTQQMQLTAMQTELAEARSSFQQERLRLLQENTLLRQKLDALARRLFGQKSEQLAPAQLQLLFQELEAPGPAVGKPSGPLSLESDSARPAASTPRPARGPRLPEHLPVLEEVIEPEPVKACPEAWRRIGEEVTERLDYEPRALPVPTDHPAQIRAPRGGGRRANRRPAARLPAGAQSRHPRAAGPRAGEQVRRSSAALSAGVHVPDPARGLAAASDPCTVGWAGGVLAASHRAGNPPERAGRRLRADR